MSKGYVSVELTGLIILQVGIAYAQMAGVLASTIPHNLDWGLGKPADLGSRPPSPSDTQVVRQ
jgi:hypothetical protein